MEIRLVSGREADWQQYVAGRSDASLYHRLEWKQVVEGTFGHRCHYLMACNGNEIQGVLPLVEMNSWMFGRFLVSVPFYNYGGILADDQDTELALAGAAARLAGDVRARHIELRQEKPLGIFWPVRQHKVAMVVPLDRPASGLWSALSSRLRGKIRKAAKGGAKFFVMGAEGLDQFYSVFTRNMRDLGTPVYPKRFFQAVLDISRREQRILIVTLNDVPVAAALALAHRDEWELPWICSNYDYADRYVNEFLYWSALEWAADNGYAAVDLGRCTRGGGGYHFKAQWKAEERQLYWHYWTAKGSEAARISPENKKYTLPIRCWQKLPLPIANFLGPHIVRGIP